MFLHSSVVIAMVNLITHPVDPSLKQKSVYTPVSNLLAYSEIQITNCTSKFSIYKFFIYQYYMFEDNMY